MQRVAAASLMGHLVLMLLLTSILAPSLAGVRARHVYGRVLYSVLSALTNSLAQAKRMFADALRHLHPLQTAQEVHTPH